MAFSFCDVESDMDNLLDNDSAFGVAMHQGDDVFPMNLMSNENITWTVERERGISFDLTTLSDVDSTPDAVYIKRKITLEAESGVKDTTFGHPFGQCRPIPQPRPPSPLPFSRSTVNPKRECMDTMGETHRAPCAPPDLSPTPASRPAAGRTHSIRSSKSGGAPDSSGKPTPATTRAKTERAAPRLHRRRAGSVDIAALTAELGLVDRRRRFARRNKGAVYRVGAYTLEERAALVARFHSRRGKRIWRKKIKYDCRKKLADKRPRLKGRFVTQEELDGFDQETLAKVTGLGPFDTESSDSDIEGDSDSSEGCNGLTSTTSRSRGGGRCKGDDKREVQESSPPAQPLLICPRRKTKKTSARNRQRQEKAKNTPEVCTTLAGVSPDSTRDCERSTGTPIGQGDEFGNSEVSAMFDVETDAEESRQGGDQDDNAIKVQSCETTDLVSAFMVDEIISSNFNVVPNYEIEAMSDGVTVN